MAKVEIIELLIDETKLEAGINAVSVVESPAIEENFIALKKHEVELKEVDAEKRILMGAALVPNKQIYRRNKDKEFYIYFSEDTVRKASELFLMRSNQNNATYEHERKMLDGMTVVESWIIEDEKTDKSRLYNFNLPKGTWMISMKVNNDDVWQKVKDGEVKGFSIEGHFVDKYEMSLQQNEEDEIIAFLKEILDTKLETYNDYPKEASENAKIALRYAEENGWGDCGTPVGKARANQLANGENISRETISRMASFARHKENSQKELGDGCGRLMWLSWGGDAGIEWAQRKLEQIDNK
jgi:phage head maturation protease